jgi:hypothetical protein
MKSYIDDDGNTIIDCEGASIREVERELGKKYRRDPRLGRPIHEIKWPTPNTRQQTRLESAIETSVDMSIGFMVSWGVLLWIVPVGWPEYDPPAGAAFGITVVFTVTSWIRRYLTRRFFARRFHVFIHELVRRMI